MPVSVTPVAGTTHDVVLGNEGLLLTPGGKRTFDVTNFSPGVQSRGDTRFRDFSLQQTWELSSWHHGRGALEWSDPFSFYDSRGVDTRIHGQLILCPLQNLTQITGPASVAGNPTRFLISGTAGTVYACTGGSSREVFTWDNTNSLWVDVNAGLTTDPVDMVEFLGYVWVAQGEANNIRRRLLSTGVWSDGGVPADFLAAGAVGTAGGSAMWRADNINELYFTVDGTNWTGPLYVGDTNTFIRGLLIWDNRLYVGKDDGLYVVQEGRVNQLLDFSFARDSNNFRWMKVWQGNIYFPILNGLYRLVGGFSLQSVGPDRGAAGFVEMGNITAADKNTFKSLASGRTGRIVDLIPTENFLYALIDGVSGTSQIIAYNGSGWHNMVEGAATNTRIRAAIFTSTLASTGVLAIPRLWYGYGNDIYNIILPDGTEDPFEYSSQTYVDGGASVYIDSPWFDADLPDVWKEWQEVIVISENLSSTELVQVSYELDDLGAFTTLINPENSDADYAFTYSPYQRIAFPKRSVSKRIRLRLLPDRGSTNTESPKIKRVIVKYMVRPNTRYAWQLQMRAGDKIRNPYLKIAEAADPTEWLERLQRARNARFRLAFDDGDLEPGITNLVLNPEFHPDTNSDGLADNWSEIGTPTTTLDVSYKMHGLRSQKVVTAASGTEGVRNTSTMAVTVGSRYTASAWIYHKSGDPINFGIFGTTNVISVSPNSDFQRYEVTFVATATTVRISAERISDNATQATTFYVSAVQLELTPNDRFANYEVRATSFCSGEQPRCRWTGTPHASTSIRDGTVQVALTNIGATETKRPSIAGRLRGEGTETLISFTLAEIAS